MFKKTITDRKKFTEISLDLVIQALERINNNEMSVKETANLYNVHRTTVYNWLHYQKDIKEKMANKVHTEQTKEDKELLILRNVNNRLVIINNNLKADINQLTIENKYLKRAYEELKDSVEKFKKLALDNKISLDSKN